MRTCEAWHPRSTHESGGYRAEKKGDAGDALRVGPPRCKPHMSSTLRVWQLVENEKTKIQRL